MALLNFILNLAGLLLWVNWRAFGFREFVPYRSTLIHTLRRAAPAKPHRWIYLATLFALLVVRGMIYRQFGTGLGWVPQIDLLVVSLPFRSDLPWRMMFFSFASFGLTLGVFYLWLLVLSLANRSVPDSQPVQHLVRLHLGRAERLPWFVKLLLPVTVVVGAWVALHPLLANLGILPSGAPGTLLLQQGLVFGFASLLACKFLLMGVLLLHLLNSYVYLGRSPFWDFVTQAARNLLRVIAWLPLRLGRVDFAPVVGMALVWGVAELDARGLAELFRRLPLF